MKYEIDITKLRDQNITVEGWTLPKNLKERPTFFVQDSKGNPVKFEKTFILREDIPQVYKLKIDFEPYFGFQVVFPYDDLETYTLFIRFDKSERKMLLSKDIVNERNSVNFRKKKFYKSYFTMDNVKNASRFLINNGPSAFMKKLKSKFNGGDFECDYDSWYRKTKVTNEELEEQKNCNFQYKPKFSIVIPLYDTKESLLKLLLNSIYNQTYQNFEICVADATDYSSVSSHTNNPEIILEEYKTKFGKLKVKYLNTNLGISDNTNAAFELAEGDYIVLCDHDDELSLNALYECALCLNNDKNIRVIYSDEDKIDFVSKTYFEPHFKSDFNLDLLLSVNYFCHLFVCEKKLLCEVSDLKNGKYIIERCEYDGAQDYDLFLRIVNKLLPDNTSQIYHIPKVLYHWRCHTASTADRPESKLYAFDAGKKALEDFYKNTSINFLKTKEIKTGVSLGFYHTIFDVEDEELISIIIPNKDHIKDLDTCIKSIRKSSYKKYEFIVVENNSTKSETFNYYSKIQEQCKDVKVVFWNDEFNYSAINNFGVNYAKGKYLLFLNNDIEMKSSNSIYEMFSYIVRNDVGIVGAKLLYSDETIQHAGVVIGFGGIAGHTFIGIYDKENAYMHRNQAICDYSAVTAACLMTKKSIFEQVGGFSTDLKIAFNDIDFCLKVRKLDKLVVYNPYAEFYHYESKTRGLEDTKEKVERFNSEIVSFGLKWPDILKNGDPYYNPNLTLRKSNFSLRDLKYEKIGEPFKLDFSIEKRIKEAKNHRR